MGEGGNGLGAAAGDDEGVDEGVEEEDLGGDGRGFRGEVEEGVGVAGAGEGS